MIEKLADLASTFPAQAIHALRLMVPIQKEPGMLYGWQEHVKRLIGAVLASDNGAAKGEAERTREELTARGFRGFDSF